MRSPKAALDELITSYEREAGRLEGAVPLFEARRELALLVSKRIVDKLEADVGASDAERERFLRERFGSLQEPLDIGVITLDGLAKALRDRELALVELFSDRVLDFAEEARAATVAAKARAGVLRETVVALRSVETAPEDSGRVDASAPAPEPAEAPPAPADAAHELLEGGAGLPEPSGGLRLSTPADDQVYGPGPSLDSSTVYRS
jgi:hypothetical protein